MAAKTSSFDLSPDNNLSRYLQRARNYPMLEASEEVSLAGQWRDDQNAVALERLVASHLRLVVKIAMGYRGYGLPVGDLIAEGNIGMMQALRRFDPDRGFRLATYAMWWIRAAIQEYILHSWSLVKMGTTASQKKLFFNLRRLKGQLKAIEDGDLRPEHVSEIAVRLKVSETDVVSMNRRMLGPDHSLNAPLSDEGDGEWQDRLKSEYADQEYLLSNHQQLVQQRDLLTKAMRGLSQRERHIIKERRLKETPATLQNLSDHFGISRERVRQIEVRAFEKLCKFVKNLMISEHMAR
ncbi:MAG: RNA polymerase sigma factor RpoH [Alphaproteobacteria bacterium]|nr:RNA polymerase sigma factor RpoH [Alphaproteobacteria bacterium]